MKIKIMAVLLVLFFIGFVVSVYHWIDRSISLAYANQSADDAFRSLRNVEGLLLDCLKGMSREAVLERLNREAARYPAENITVKKEGSVIWFNQTRFEFERGELKSIGEVEVK